MPTQFADPTTAIRRFNRFYTRRMGLLEDGLLRSPFSLTEVRVLFELAHRTRPTASELCQVLSLDPGYLSRILRGLRRAGLVLAGTSKADGRQRLLSLSDQGQKIFGALDARSSQEVRAMLAPLSPAEQHDLVQAMAAVEALLGRPREGPPLQSHPILRGPKPGDLGWVVQRHGELYAAEYQWDARFEGLVAEIVGRFAAHFDPSRERCWIAELNGQKVGSVFLVKDSETVAKLRLLLVEPWARGQGLGSLLVRTCVEFARQAGFTRIRLWTNDVLHAARHVYQQVGFELVAEEPHSSFGHNLVGQTWELSL
jgi:DNA-binding MarR family transcriptional regulator/N-acetylglutamate synthase-like GNAT family acetyltransferase